MDSRLFCVQIVRNRALNAQVHNALEQIYFVLLNGCINLIYRWFVDNKKLYRALSRNQNTDATIAFMHKVGQKPDRSTEVKFCTRCVISNQRPRMVFNKE